MKKNIWIFLLGLVFFVTGCFDDDDDGYSLGDVYIGFGMVEQIENDPVRYKINMDDGDMLYPIVYNYNYPWYYYGDIESQKRLKSGDRILLNYTILDDDNVGNSSAKKYFVRVNSVKKILLKGILDITDENKDSIGNDPIIVKNIWLKDSLLNFEIKYYGRYQMHYINLVKKPGEITADDQPVELELRHNENEDNKDFPYASYVSFNLNAIKINGLDSTKFKVFCRDYNDELFEFEGVFHYNLLVE